MTRTYLPFGILTCAALLLGCEKDKEKGSPIQARLALANITGMGLNNPACPDLGDGPVSECWTPSIYGMKLMNVIVSPDEQGAQSAPAGLIWANPDCAIKTSQTEIDEKEYEYDSPSDCTDDQVDSFFELARPTEEVNAELNSQPYKILPGTYHYVQLGFCEDSAKSRNGRFQADGMSEPYETILGGCGLSSLRADPPIVVTEGQSIIVSLTYDLTNTVYIGHEGSSEDYCFKNADNSIVRCAAGPNNLMPGFAQE
jgi:hypothetical protein